MMEKSEGLIRKIASLQEAVLLRAKKESDIIMPGYTHLQQAQPILWSHYLMALFWMLQRDRERVRSCQERLSVSPLGSGALAGIAYPINREELAKELGFSSESENSIDAVSDRDFIIEFLATCTILMMHLSRFSEDLTIWSSVEFGFVEVDQAYATGSSLMPQKKNPDSLELIRGKAARVIGSLTTVLSMMKGVPLTYSKDLQEDKEPLFDSIATVFMSLEVFTGVLATMEVRRERMLSSMDEKVYATDVADYLTKKGVPFRKAHEIVGRLVQQLVVEGKKFSDLPLPVYKGFSRLFEYDIYRVFDSRRQEKAFRSSFGKPTGV
jgi:argininosuccinate lyase